jgi:hypothetical protein
MVSTPIPTTLNLPIGLTATGSLAQKKSAASKCYKPELVKNILGESCP